MSFVACALRWQCQLCSQEKSEPLDGYTCCAARQKSEPFDGHTCLLCSQIKICTVPWRHLLSVQLDKNLHRSNATTTQQTRKTRCSQKKQNNSKILLGHAQMLTFSSGL